MANKQFYERWGNGVFWDGWNVLSFLGELPEVSWSFEVTENCQDFWFSAIQLEIWKLNNCIKKMKFKIMKMMKLYQKSVKCFKFFHVIKVRSTA